MLIYLLKITEAKYDLKTSQTNQVSPLEKYSNSKDKNKYKKNTLLKSGKTNLDNYMIKIT